MSSHWWRAYDEAVDDPKLQMLPDRLFRAWFNLCCITSANGGTLPPADVIAFKLRITASKVERLIEELRAAVLIDTDESGSRPHNWNGRQFKSDVTDPTAPDRMRRHRNKKRNGTVTSTVTVTHPETDTETEYSEAKASGVPPSDPKSDLFRRAREVLGPKQGGSITAKLLKSQGKEDDPNVIAKVRARIEEASTKAAPIEWLGRVMAGPAQKTTSDGHLFPEGII